MQDAIAAMTRQLSALRGLLQKAEDHCAARRIDPSVLLGCRLFPDMYPLSRQVQIACDHAKGAAHRLAGREVPSVPDVETTFAELRDRIDRTATLVRELPAEAYEGAETRTVTLKMRTGEVTFTGRDYLWKFALPNLYFHAATAYNILRHNGVELGKRDFLGAS
ncbi:hypothetical protein Rumeso_00811 [Rubellimicrobium mesophilum DSM 19309]|uniref:DUF1993 domain-containing protein n=1 Tax=Rubellimicrobium mesophilum DSM 19309 TaxID=442562 RepID=A0A017HTJ3_9RHOB|nr:DUF1993 domain-containing protein [Rubellimicrobium mesophilum]EYD77645.1 hypothetical protein Rumeso_00811 [Rubellimicrobium mesophilum DSM 19309]